MPGEAAHVQLVDDRLDERSFQRRIALPIVGTGIRNDAFHCGIAAPNGNRQAVRIEQHLVPIEAQPLLGLERPDRPEAVELARAKPRNKNVPVVVGAMPSRVERDCPRRLRIILVVEQQQFHKGGALRIHAEVHASSPDRRSQRRTRISFNIGNAHVYEHSEQEWFRARFRGGDEKPKEIGTRARRPLLSPIATGAYWSGSSGTTVPLTAPPHASELPPEASRLRRSLAPRCGRIGPRPLPPGAQSVPSLARWRA